MRIIEVVPTKRFRGHWCSDDGDGIQPAFPKKQQAIDYACSRFCGSVGEIHIYDDAGDQIVEVITVYGGSIARPRTRMD
jgi:hypothetical protein